MSNSAAGGNFLDKVPRDCLRIIESKSKVRNSRNKPVVAKVSLSSSTPGISPDVSELKDMVKALLPDMKNQNQAPTPVKAVRRESSGTLPSNTITNPKVDLKGITIRSGVAYQGHKIPTTSSSPPKVVERESEVTKDTVPPTNNGSTKDVQPPVVQIQSQVPNFEPAVAPVSALMPNLKPSIPYPSRLAIPLLIRPYCILTVFPTLTPFGDSDFLLKEVDAFLALEDDPTSPEVDDSYYDPEGDILLLESFLNDDPSLPPPT
ncbi:hypothetical protein Tco_0026749 [Tanacetum coccineum]